MAAFSGAKVSPHAWSSKGSTGRPAVLWHGGEAERAAAGFRALDAQDRDALVAFLRSL